MTFEELAKAPPKFDHLSNNCGTSFWEDLYQCFKERLENEQREKLHQLADGYILKPQHPDGDQI